MTTTTGAGAVLATGLPPGWLEVGAFDDERALTTFLDALLDVDADRFDPGQRDALVHACLLARAAVHGQGWLHLGAVATYVHDGDGQWRTTLWTVGVGLVAVPDLDDVNPVGLAERVLGRVEAVEAVESFRLDDGRDGVALSTTARLDLATLPVDADQLHERLPGLTPGALGVVVYLLPVPGLPGHLGLTVGVAPNRGERTPLSFLAGQMATSVRRVEDVRELPAHQILVDTTGTTVPRGSLDTAEPR